MYSSDVKPTTKQLWEPHIGVLEMGILGATRLMPMKIKEGKGGTTDAYCVSKCGYKCMRTRTVVDSLSLKWNEQYIYEVFGPCTVITIDALCALFECEPIGEPEVSSYECGGILGSDLDIHPTWTPDSPMLRMFIQMNCMRNLTHSQQVKVHMWLE
ncbi:Calcium-dependent lipid-binding (CaLB domain) plant phosphoribosyltransferase family protein, putative [Theobroma cacao]|uniref:Calcium-dependent lipid-binding (CaLB domain) plant phosphoribosyltransferase family protein, putative n=1 Tax=Theobroma cacao TaxID=3641 RepID=A0A061DN90_THECC|nr:Calcium-dependent lipid-binding (CaLB domain) plant phosphoribosyltransferase family protein, putative [Theobroma cacao]